MRRLPTGSTPFMSGLMRVTTIFPQWQALIDPGWSGCPSFLLLRVIQPKLSIQGCTELNLLLCKTENKAEGRKGNAHAPCQFHGIGEDVYDLRACGFG